MNKYRVDQLLHYSKSAGLDTSKTIVEIEALSLLHEWSRGMPGNMQEITLSRFSITLAGDEPCEIFILKDVVAWRGEDADVIETDFLYREREEAEAEYRERIFNATKHWR